MELLENYKLYIDKEQILKHNTSEIKAKQLIGLAKFNISISAKSISIHQKMSSTSKDSKVAYQLSISDIIWMFLTTHINIQGEVFWS
ncbi:hypothetical protein RhiirA1_459811 [Rhizophagus irregularis]|uniref:Uncharacterized protein n=1 Tax=Rhizophagus irregularis TaxID=588596 RepID=A0A2N0RSU2_9GLOM|nr:hypothetical protein RhiirA1_459811 [Rhizophagus irregularis]